MWPLGHSCIFYIAYQGGSQEECSRRTQHLVPECRDSSGGSRAGFCVWDASGSGGPRQALSRYEECTCLSPVLAAARSHRAAHALLYLGK